MKRVHHMVCEYINISVLGKCRMLALRNVNKNDQKLNHRGTPVQCALEFNCFKVSKRLEVKAASGRVYFFHKFSPASVTQSSNVT